MTLIKSISGIRGTIGSVPGENLTPLDVVKFTSAYCTWLLNQEKGKTIIIGRDARLSGKMVSDLVAATAVGMGIDVIDLGLSTTPTVEMAVMFENAAGGIILTASHNPKEWNALKLLNHKGEFIGHAEAQTILDLADADEYSYASVTELGTIKSGSEFLQKHVNAILDLDLVDVEAIKNANFKVAIDAVNSTGGITIPALLKALNVAEIVELNCEPTGVFAHNPEPLPENLGQTSLEIKRSGCDVGFVVDPDVDRLAIICEDGSMFGEEYTLVAISDYILQHQKGNTVSNLSSTIALREVTEGYNQNYYAAAVGEVNVVVKMKEVNAVIGGEGNGGIIYPALHYGRDALVGIALFLTQLAKSGKSCSALRVQYPKYHIAKKKINLDPNLNVDALLTAMAQKYNDREKDTQDGLKIYLDGSDWVHLRKSNTEAIIRIYAESGTESTANAIADNIINNIKELSTNT